jgi:EAL domain-containing protein (putative c-di-GMP-specific phosphodiesterase class I)
VLFRSAEETGLILKLGDWVLQTACKQAAQWRQTGNPDFRIAVNVSARQLLQEDLADRVEQILRDTGLPPEHLELELTESLLIQNIEAASVTLNRLHALGVHLSLDDFGTGYSALGYLNKFPLSSVKIDRSFIAGVTTDSYANTLARSIIGMAHELDMTVVAEGVETGEQIEFLSKHRCDEMQGFHISRPIPAAAFDRFLRDFNPAGLNRLTS